MSRKILDRITDTAHSIDTARHELAVLESRLDVQMARARSEGHSLREIERATGHLYTNATVYNRTRGRVTA
jgi:hypothetical protein